MNEEFTESADSQQKKIKQLQERFNGFCKNNSKYIQFCICLIIGLLTVFFIEEKIFKSSYGSMLFEDVEPAKIYSLLISLLFIAWLLESFLEILLKAFNIDSPQDNEKQKSAKSKKTAQFTAIVGFLIGLIIAWSGVHTISMFFSFSEQTTEIEKVLFGSVDTILTAGVIAGGSKGIHELTNAYKEILQAIKKQAT